MTRVELYLYECECGFDVISSHEPGCPECGGEVLQRGHIDGVEVHPDNVPSGEL